LGCGEKKGGKEYVGGNMNVDEGDEDRDGCEGSEVDAMVLYHYICMRAAAQDVKQRTSDKGRR
jgi:hypothetical protein